MSQHGNCAYNQWLHPHVIIPTQDCIDHSVMKLHSMSRKAAHRLVTQTCS